MEVIFLIGASQAVFLSFLGFKKKNKTTGDLVFASWMLFIGLHLLDYYLGVTGFILEHPYLLGIGAVFPMLQGPFMFVYVMVMMNKTGKLKPIYLLHGLPFLLISLFLVFDFYFLSGSEKIAYYALQEVDPNFVVSTFQILNVYLGPIYVVLSLLMLRRHEKNIAENFSYTEQIDLKWLKYVISGLGFVWITVFITQSIIGYVPHMDSYLSSQLIYLSLTIAVFFLGYYGIKQKAIYISIANDEVKEEPIVASPTIQDDESVRYKNSGLKQSDADVYLKQLLDYMDNEKPYLNGKLSLKQVSDYMGISVNHVSQVINEQVDKSFFDFVNEYRIEEVKNRIHDPKYEQYTLLAVAYDSGFNSKSSFNSIFKKLCGITPSQFAKQATA